MDDDILYILLTIVSLAVVVLGSFVASRRLAGPAEDDGSVAGAGHEVIGIAEYNVRPLPNTMRNRFSALGLCSCDPGAEDSPV